GHEHGGALTCCRERGGNPRRATSGDEDIDLVANWYRSPKGNLGHLASSCPIAGCGRVWLRGLRLNASQVEATGASTSRPSVGCLGLKGVPPIFVDRLVEGPDVLYRRQGLDVVDGVEDETAIPAEDAQAFADFLTYLIRGAER